jgi:phosphonate transport system substrate-binding protein
MVAWRAAVLVLLALGAIAAGGVAAERPLSFGVLNQQSPALTAERWNPVLHYVSARSGVPLRLRMGPTVQDTDAMMGRGEFDFMFTNHNFQSEFDSIGYGVIARWGGDPIHGVIAVLADSPIRTLQQLHQRRVAFPSADAFVGYAVPIVALRRAGVVVEEVFAGNQEGVLAQLRARRVDAASVNSRFLRQYADRENMQVREIFVSEGFPDLAVIAHPRVPAATVAKVRKAFLGMKGDPAAAPILARAQCPGFEPAEDQDYAGVRRVYRLIEQ